MDFAAEIGHTRMAIVVCNGMRLISTVAQIIADYVIASTA